MAIYMPPIARKMRVPEKYNPDTFRVIGENAELFHAKFPDAIISPVFPMDPGPAQRILPNVPIRETRIFPHPTDDFRANNPQPVRCGFLCHNARFFNEPICTVHTRRTHPEQHRWWPARINTDPLKIPAYSYDSMYRSDYQFDKNGFPKGNTRHLANPNTEPALGTIPINSLESRATSQRLFQENVSFEHQYDSRSDPNYYPRLKRHGSFVWHRLQPDKTQLLRDYRESVDSRRQIEAQIIQKAKDEKEEAESHRPPVPKIDNPFPHIIPGMAPQAPPDPPPIAVVPVGPPQWPYPENQRLVPYIPSPDGASNGPATTAGKEPVGEETVKSDINPHAEQEAECA